MVNFGTSIPNHNEFSLHFLFWNRLIVRYNKSPKKITEDRCPKAELKNPFLRSKIMKEIKKVEFYRHSLREEDIREVVKVLNSLFLTTGPVTAQVEEKLARYLDVKHVLCVTSCTSALFLSLKALGIGPGDEVITTPMTFIATANVILHTGATPVFVDVEPSTGNIDLEKFERAITPKTKAVIPVHLYGQMVDMKALSQICRDRGIHIVEDAAHALESSRKGVKPGQLGDTACFSFYATKNLTSGEGGAIALNDTSLYETLKKMRLHGMSKSAAERYSKKYRHWDMELLGYKANLPDVLSALLLHQIDRLEEQLQRREAICRQYEEAFSQIPGLDFPKVLPDSRSARHLFTIWVPRDRRDQTLSQLQEWGIGVAVNFRAVHLLSYYRKNFGFKPGDFPAAEEIGDRTITLPLYPSLKDEEVQYIIGAVREIAQTW